MAEVGALAVVAVVEGAPSPSLGDPLPQVRQAVRALLVSSPAYLALDPARRRQMAEAMVRVCHAAASLIREEVESDHDAHYALGQAAGTSDPHTASTPTSDRPEKPLARAQSAGDSFSGVAASRVAGTTRAILNAVSFPRFVTELINGVFKALVDTNMQQMNSYVELLNNVATSTEGFADSNLGPNRARAWLAERYPASFELSGDTTEPGEPPDEDAATETALRLRPGASWPSADALRADLGLADDESIPSGDPDRTLVPLARRALAKQRQQMLATMVMLGMQRIVIESGRINASMRFHIDTRSAAQEDKGSSFDTRTQLSAGGSYGVGPWGVSASVSSTIGYVSTQRTQTSEEMNTDLDLNSSVELYFKTDYLPLDKMAGRDKADRIRVNTLNPEAEAKAAAEARATRATRAAEGDTARRAAMDRAMPPPPAPAPLAPPPQPPSARTPSSSPPATSSAPSAGTQAGAARTPTAGPGGSPPSSSGSTTSPTTTPATTGSGTGTASRPATSSQPQSVTDGPTRATAPQARPSASVQFDDVPSADYGEQVIFERTIEHSDPANFPINLPEPGNGEERFRFAIPDGLKFTHWEVTAIDLTPLAGYRINAAPSRGSAGKQSITVAWWHPPYGKIRLQLRAYASATGQASPVAVVYDSPGWLEQCRDRIQQSHPFNVVVRGDNAERLHTAIEMLKREQSQKAPVQPLVEPVMSTVIIVGLIVFAAIAVVGLIVLYVIVKEALDKGYDIRDTGFKVAVGEGPLRQEHELILNLSPPSA